MVTGRASFRPLALHMRCNNGDIAQPHVHDSCSVSGSQGLKSPVFGVSCRYEARRLRTIYALSIFYAIWFLGATDRDRSARRRIRSQVPRVLAGRNQNLKIPPCSDGMALIYWRREDLPCLRLCADPVSSVSPNGPIAVWSVVPHTPTTPCVITFVEEGEPAGMKPFIARCDRRLM